MAISYIDFLLKAPTRADIRNVLVGAGMWIPVNNSVTPPVPAHAADGIFIDELGPVITTPAVMNGTIVITPAVWDNNIHANVRVMRAWVVDQLENREELDAEGRVLPLRFLTKLGRWFEEGTLGTHGHVRHRLRNNVYLMYEDDIATLIRVWQ